MNSINKVIFLKLDLENNFKKISVIDDIKIQMKYLLFIKILNDYDPNNIHDLYIKNFYTKKENIIKNIICSNYLNNLFNSLYFVLGNPYSIDLDIFQIIYKNRNYINEIPKILINKCDIVIKKYFKFYNYEIIKRWYDTIINKPLDKKFYFYVSKLSEKNKNAKWKKYITLWNLFDQNCIIFKNYLKSILSLYKNSTHDIIGCSNINKKFYKYCIESNIGMSINIEKVYNWAFKEINFLKNKLIQIFNKISPNNNNYLEILTKIKKDPSQKFISKKEVIQLYNNKLNKYKKFYYDKFNLSKFDDINLIIFDNKLMGGGYYSNNNFYLNTYYWKKLFKFTTESLILHETIPGHHLQMSSIRKTDYIYFFKILNGFIEGWGLFSENLGIEQTDWDKIGQIQYEILRTMRIIIDINLHYYGKTIDDMVILMSEYLIFDKKIIKNEIIRYICNPGQALSYKIGSEVFKKILEKENINDFVNNNSIELYKKIIHENIPLKFLIDKYKIDNLFIS